jgi:hypothetical protein
MMGGNGPLTTPRKWAGFAVAVSASCVEGEPQDVSVRIQVRKRQGILRACSVCAPALPLPTPVQINFVAFHKGHQKFGSDR